MSIYKKTHTLWQRVEGLNEEDTQRHIEDSIVGVLSLDTDVWFSLSSVCGIFLAHTIHQQDAIMAAVRTLTLNDRVRYQKNGKIQYKPSTHTLNDLFQTEFNTNRRST